MTEAKTLETLVEDIYKVLEEGVDMTDEETEALGKRLGESVRHSLKRQKGGTLRMSNIGKPCARQLYYEVNSPEEKEPLKGPQYMKFLTGHVLEDLLLYLCEVAGHTVEGRQDEVEMEGILGHRDAIIDGTVIDCKSASTYSFKKFENHELSGNDPFGYLTQIESYRRTGESDDRVTDKERCGFLVVDKTLGNICLDLYGKQSFPIEKLYQYRKELMKRPEPPARAFEDVPEGKSGNRKLGVNCSYCEFKNKCWPDLKTYAYARGPVFLTKVVKSPKVDEVDNVN